MPGLLSLRSKLYTFERNAQQRKVVQTMRIQLIDASSASAPRTKTLENVLSIRIDMTSGALYARTSDLKDHKIDLASGNGTEVRIIDSVVKGGK